MKLRRAFEKPCDRHAAYEGAESLRRVRKLMQAFSGVTVSNPNLLRGFFITHNFSSCRKVDFFYFKSKKKSDW